MAEIDENIDDKVVPNENGNVEEVSQTINVEDGKQNTEAQIEKSQQKQVQAQVSTESIKNDPVVQENSPKHKVSVQSPTTQALSQTQITQTSKVLQQKEQQSAKKIQQPSQVTSEIKQETGKKDKQTKTVQISVKKLKKYVKLETDYENQKKEIESIKQQYNKIAKDLISTRQDLDKKSIQFKEAANEQKSTQQKLAQTLNELKSAQNELKTRQDKIQKLQQQYSNLSKKVKEEQKTSQKLTGMEETIKQLQKMLDGSTKNQQLYLREAEKHKEMLRIEKEMNSNLKSEVQQLRFLSGEHFSLKQQVSRLLVELKSLQDAKEKYPIMVEKYEHSEQINQKLKESIRQLETKNQQSKTIIEKLEKKIDRVTEEKRNLEKKVASTLAEKEQREGEIQAFKMELEDQRTEIEVQRKRYTAEIKDLKLALHHEHQKLKLTEIQLQESKKKQKKTVNLDGVKFSSLSKEDLFNLIEQLQMKNASIKINLNALLEDITLKDLKIKDLQATLMTLTRHIVKALPNLDESEGMEYVEKEIIEAGKGTKADWPQIVQKVLVQNLRLKNSVTALGQEFNMRLRAQMEKNNK